MPIECVCTVTPRTRVDESRRGSAMLPGRGDARQSPVPASIGVVRSEIGRMELR